MAKAKLVEIPGQLTLFNYVYHVKDIAAEIFPLGKCRPAKETPEEKILGEDICPNCHGKRILYSRKISDVTYVTYICNSCNHSHCVSTTYYGKFHEGDRVRLYDRTFEKNARIILNTYKEGVVTKVYCEEPYGYLLDFKVEDSYIGGKKTPNSSWVIGSMVTRLQHKCFGLELVEAGNAKDPLVTVIKEVA